MDSSSNRDVEAAWLVLEARHVRIAPLHPAQLFAADPSRATRFSSEGGGLFLDYSNKCIAAETLSLLLRLAEESGVAARRDAMFRREKINNTEKRAVIHTALHAPRGTRIEVDGKDVAPQVCDVSRSDGGFGRLSSLRRRCGSAIKELSTLFTRHPEDT